VEPQDFINEVSQLGDPIELTNRFNLIFWSLMAFNLIVFALVRTFNPGYLRILFRTAFNNRQLINNIREDLNLRGITSILLNLTYFTCAGIIAWKTTHSDLHNVILILVGALFIGAFIKLVVIQLLMFFTTAKIGLQEHFINHLLFFQIGGIVLTPILIFTQYVTASYCEITLISILVVMLLIIIIRELQSLTRAIQHKISYFYIILYLCTLEILPLVVGIRVFILNNGVLN
jgi:hypothetical protein